MRTGIALAFFAALIASKVNGQPGAASSADTPEGIAGARKELDRLKSARDAGLLPGNNLPRVDLPPLPALQSGVPRSTPAKPPKPNTAATKSGNWLLEAMEKGDPPDDTHAETDDPRDRIRGPRRRNEKLGTSVEGRGTAAAADEERKPEVAVVSPFARYMADWISPQDLSLLKPALAAPEARIEAGPAATANIAIVSGPGGLNDLLLGGSPASSVPPPPRENPYLEALKPELPAPMAVPPPLKPPELPPSRAVSTPAVPAPATPPVQSKIPDFARPSADEKYFKQLKRF